MDMNRMTVKLQEALQAASAQAMRRGHQGIDAEHLLLALLEQEGGLAPALVDQSGVSGSAVRQAVEQALAKVPQVQGPGAAPGQRFSIRPKRISPPPMMKAPVPMTMRGPNLSTR